MSARFALLFASILNDTMLYPRLLFSDNMEDKGMEEERSRNFQRLVVRRLNEMPNQDYQLIFATSMIAPELETPEYTIGEKYTQENKSLKFFSRHPKSGELTRFIDRVNSNDDLS